MTTGFEWAVFYPELANKILEYKAKRMELLSIVSDIFGRVDLKNYISEHRSLNDDICPFTVMGVFNRGITNANRTVLLRAFADSFSISADVPESFDGVPVLNNMMAIYYGGKDWDGGKKGYTAGVDGYDSDVHIERLWELFEAAINLADNPTQAGIEAFVKAFDFVISQPISKWMTTCGLFWIRPFNYVSLDANMKAYLKNTLEMSYKFSNLPSGERYLNMCNEIITKLSDIEGIDSIPALSHDAWLNNRGQVSWWPSEEEYHPGIHEEQWKELLSDEKVFTPNAKTIMVRMLAFENGATCTQLSIRFGGAAGFYNTESFKLAQRVWNYTGCEILNDKNENARWWPILYTGRRADKDDEGSYIWRLRPELRAALISAGAQSWKLPAEDPSGDDEPEVETQGVVIKNEFELRVLNYLGGLKKTHSILTRAPLYELNNGNRVIIRTSKLLSTGYFYGLQKLIVDGDYMIDNLVLVAGEEGFYNIPFETIKGWCLNGYISLADKGKSTNESVMGYRIHIALIDGSYKLKFLGNEAPLDLARYFTKFTYDKVDFLFDVYMSSGKYDEIADLVGRKMNIVLQGAPGVGKSYLAKRLAFSLIGAKDQSKVTMMQFHQSYSYEDFIEGYRPDGKGGFYLKDGVFFEFCETAKKCVGNHYFIIDEINRGNLSKIMGELMLLIESDKRGDEFAVPLTYSGRMFYVPDNVYIIGMMNTADRSLAMMDYALRRRFSFVPIEPAFKHSGFIEYIKKDDVALGERILTEMKALNADIKKDLGAGFQIGHSYFCNSNIICESWYESVLRYEILPLLDEYWFDNEKQHSKWVERLLPNEKDSD